MDDYLFAHNYTPELPPLDESVQFLNWEQLKEVLNKTFGVKNGEEIARIEVGKKGLRINFKNSPLVAGLEDFELP